MGKADIQKTDQSKVVLYQTADGKVTVDVRFARETFWLTQKALAELFGVQTPAVSRHLKNIFESGELVEDSVVSILETTAADGKELQEDSVVKESLTTASDGKESSLNSLEFDGIRNQLN